jgi:hypothetical protein
MISLTARMLMNLPAERSMGLPKTMHAPLRDLRSTGFDAEHARTCAVDIDDARAERVGESFAGIVEAGIYDLQLLRGDAYNVKVHVGTRRPVSQLLTSEERAQNTEAVESLQLQAMELLSRLPFEAPAGDILELPVLNDEDGLIASLVSCSEGCTQDFDRNFPWGSSVVIRTGEAYGHLFRRLLCSLTPAVCTYAPRLSCSLTPAVFSYAPRLPCSQAKQPMLAALRTPVLKTPLGSTMLRIIMKKPTPRRREWCVLIAWLPDTTNDHAKRRGEARRIRCQCILFAFVQRVSIKTTHCFPKIKSSVFVSEPTESSTSMLCAWRARRN